jgi:hypothetical protein
MLRTVTAVYRTHAIADLVREELQSLGVQLGSISIVPDRDDPVTPGGTRDDARYNDDLHDLHVPQDDLRSYQNAVRRGDYVVSANVDDDKLDRALEIMRRPEESYMLDELDDEFRTAPYAAHTTGTSRYGHGTTDEAYLARRDEARDPYVRSYTRDRALGDRPVD